MGSEQKFAFSNAPIWEVGLSVMGQGVPFYDPYDVRSLHDAFRERFPKSERQPSFPSLQPFMAPGSVVPAMPSFQFAMLGAVEPQRWWFVGTDGRDLAQFQDNFIARNWRRLEPAPAALVNYPGFDKLLEDFQMIVTQIRNRQSTDSKSEPTLCDLLYDNLIPMKMSDGTLFKSKDVFPSFGIRGAKAVLGLNMQWIERIDAAISSAPDLHVMASSVATPSASGGEPEPYIKLTFNARTTVSSWAETWSFFRRAHDRIRTRLIELTSDQCRATWGAYDPS